MGRTLPPRASMWARIGAQSRSGWLPSRKAVCEPCHDWMRPGSSRMDATLPGALKSSGAVGLGRGRWNMMKGMLTKKVKMPKIW